MYHFLEGDTSGSFPKYNIEPRHASKGAIPTEGTNMKIGIAKRNCLQDILFFLYLTHQMKSVIAYNEMFQIYYTCIEKMSSPLGGGKVKGLLCDITGVLRESASSGDGVCINVSFKEFSFLCYKQC